MSQSVKQSFESLIQAVKSDASNAQASFEVTSTLEEGVRVKNTVRGFEFGIDEPAVLGGTNSAANPVEQVLASLGACQAITYKALASLKGIRLDNVTVKTKGHLDLRGFLGLDESIRPGYEKITFETIIESGESNEKLNDLVKQVEALCPVLDILSNPVPVTGRVSIKRAAEVVI